MRKHIGIALCLALASAPLATAEPSAPSLANASASDALEALQSCAARLDPDLDVGYTRIVQRCPGLPEQLARAGVERWLPQGWNDPANDLSAGGLRELRTLLVREAAERALGPTPAVHSLREVLSELGPGSGSRSSLWRRVVNFLHDLALRRAQLEQPHWLARLVGTIGWPQALMRALVYAGVAAVLGLAGVIIAHELRASGILGARGPGGGSSPALIRGRRLTLRDVESAPLLERAGLLLSLIVQQRGASPGQRGLRSLTARELLQVPWPEPGGAQQLERLALLAERVRYGAPPADEDVIHVAIDDGRALLQRLDALQAEVS